jgi:hypothetical protein
VKWSKKEILGHLIDSAANNHQRFVRAQLSKELSFPGYEQESWIRVQHYQTASWKDLISLWENYNRHIAHVISTMPADVLNNICIVGNGEPVTLLFLVEDYVRHMEHHLKQIFGERE